jgi:hypothetical protein
MEISEEIESLKVVSSTGNVSSINNLSIIIEILNFYLFFRSTMIRKKKKSSKQRQRIC